ncbi:MAG: hypothetical protein M5U30_15780 [Burkholderiaceae bacterium]|nr:hypothetical protein [Burkholderiaceae bacterium]
MLAGLLAAGLAAAQPVALKLDPRLGEERARAGEGRPVFGRGDHLSGRTGRETTLRG